MNINFYGIMLLLVAAFAVWAYAEAKKEHV